MPRIDEEDNRNTRDSSQLDVDGILDCIELDPDPVEAESNKDDEVL